MSSVWMKAYAWVSSPSPRSSVFWLAAQYAHLPLSHPCSVRSNQMLPSSVANDLAMECLPLAWL